MLGMLALPVAALAALILAIWPWTARYDRRVSVRLLACLVGTSAAVVGLQVLLGAFGRLGPGSLLALVGVAVLASIGLWLGRGGSWSDWRLDLGCPTGFGLALTLLAVAAYTGLALVACLVPPYGWDTLVYHLTDVFYIAQTGGLEPFPYANAQFNFPIVGELHSSWFHLLSGAGDESWRVTGLGLTILSLTGALAVRVAALGLGLRAALPWLAPAALLTPLFLIQPLAGYVDVVFAAFVLASFAFALLAVSERRTEHLAWAALAAGLALGTKLSFLYFFPPVVLVLLGREPWRRLRGRRWVAAVALSGALFSVGCGYWLGRNLLRHGNPLYPIEVRVGSFLLFEGPATVAPESDDRHRFVSTGLHWLGYPFGERFLGRLQYTVDNGFGPLFAAGLVMSPVALAFALWRRKWLLAKALAALPLTLVIWFLVSPWEHPRYALAACGFALLTLGAIYQEVSASAGPRRVMEGAIVAALLFSVPAGLLSAAPGLPEVVAEWRTGGWRPASYYAHQYGEAAAAFDWLSDNGGAHTTVSFDRGVFVAPLFGWHGRNRVVWASSAEDRGIGDATFVGDGDEWRTFLGSEDVDWVVFWRPWWSEESAPSKREIWLRERPEAFQLAAGFPRAGGIYRFDSGSATGAAEGSARRRDLTELAAADRWVVEFREGAEGRPADDPSGGLRIDYSFATAGNDYVDLRFDLTESGWPESALLEFELHAASSPAILFIYLKEADPRRACRFRVELEPGEGSRRVRLDLATPEWRSGGFDPRRVAELHIVLDDAEDAAAFEGSIRVSDFRLQLQEEAT
jgi:hypothetical protein